MLPSASQYFRSLASVEEKAICKKCGIKLNYFYNIVNHPERRVSVTLACKLEEATRRQVSRRAILPQIDWELIESTGK